jgi:hypothetical protein
MNACGDNFATVIERFDRPVLVRTHQTAVPFDIRAEDGSHFAFCTIGAHGVSYRGLEMPKRKSLWRGTEIPQRLHFQNLRVACSHGHLKKVAVMLKVDRKTDLSESRKRIDVFRRDV